jgi:hypothetical protein
MRTVFSNAELAHVWAQQSQQSGKSSGMFFEGTKIYSYGYHYILAEFLSPSLVVVNTNRYSATTSSKHMPAVRRAIPHNVQQLHVDLQRSEFQHVSNWQSLLEKAAKATKNSAYLLNELNSEINDFKRYFLALNADRYVSEQLQSWFTRQETGEFTIDNASMSAIKTQIKEREAKEIEKRKEDIQAWLNGENKHLNRLSEIYLRAKGDEVETTLGAVVPVQEAKLLFMAIRSDRPVHGIKIGYYTVNGYTNGVLTIGCHKLKDKEINRFAAAQGW